MRNRRDVINPEDWKAAKTDNFAFNDLTHITISAAGPEPVVFLVNSVPVHAGLSWTKTFQVPAGPCAITSTKPFGYSARVYDAQTGEKLSHEVIVAASIQGGFLAQVRKRAALDAARFRAGALDAGLLGGHEVDDDDMFEEDEVRLAHEAAENFRRNAAEDGTPDAEEGSRVPAAAEGGEDNP